MLPKAKSKIKTVLFEFLPINQTLRLVKLSSSCAWIWAITNQSSVNPSLENKSSFLVVMPACCKISSCKGSESCSKRWKAFVKRYNSPISESNRSYQLSGNRYFKLAHDFICRLKPPSLASTIRAAKSSKYWGGAFSISAKPPRIISNKRLCKSATPSRMSSSRSVKLRSFPASLLAICSSVRGIVFATVRRSRASIHSVTYWGGGFLPKVSSLPSVAMSKSARACLQGKRFTGQEHL